MKSQMKAQFITAAEVAEIMGVSRTKAYQIVRDMNNELKEQGAEGVILGCTEIQMLIKQKDSPVPVFDSTELHALAALDFIME